MAAADNVTGVINAGGRSTRMGRDKAFLEIGGERLIDRAVRIFRSLFDEVILVTNTPELYRPLGLPMVADIFPGAGSLGGLYTGLSHAGRDYAFFAACDMPFLNPEFIRFMLAQRPGYDVVIPRTPEEGVHPLHAAYSKACLAPMERLIRAGRLKVIGFFPEVRVREIAPEEIMPFDPEFTMFFNINTPQELAQAETIQARRS
ncbi:MAG: molybdenum cofactor guanylyltransferase [Deltaproteobacteria bacterium]|nr:molybdenum cofactor guanylyltransferase [Deltaproteobacteria bacterium]